MVGAGARLAGRVLGDLSSSIDGHARVGELSTDGRLIEELEVPDVVRCFRMGDAERHEGMRPMGVCNLRRQGSSVEARLIAGPGTVASVGLVGRLGRPLLIDDDRGLELLRLSGVVGYVCVGVPHCWAPPGS